MLQNTIPCALDQTGYVKKAAMLQNAFCNQYLLQCRRLDLRTLGWRGKGVTSSSVGATGGTVVD
eukprot:4877971-Amphidinium_carterae.1